MICYIDTVKYGSYDLLLLNIQLNIARFEKQMCKYHVFK